MLTFREFQKANSARAQRWHGDNPWSQADWMVATVGELGEAANFLKKLKRSEDGITGNSESNMVLEDGLAEELADTLIYLFLLAHECGVDLETEVIAKFNKVSEKHGFPERL